MGVNVKLTIVKPTLAWERWMKLDNILDSNIPEFPKQIKLELTIKLQKLE